MVGRGTEVVLYGQTYGWDAVPLERLLRAGTAVPAARRTAASEEVRPTGSGRVG